MQRKKGRLDHCSGGTGGQSSVSKTQRGQEAVLLHGWVKEGYVSGYSILDPEVSSYWGGSLEAWSSIVSAELMGIKLTVEWLIARKYQGDVVVVTDSKSAIQALLGHRKVSEVRSDCWDILTLTTQRYQENQ